MDKPKVENEVIKCPFCKKGNIDVTRTSEYYSYHSARAFGKVKRIPVHHSERFEVNNNCPNCRKKGGEIKEFLEKGRKPLTHSERLEIFKKRGLPLVIKSK